MKRAPAFLLAAFLVVSPVAIHKVTTRNEDRLAESAKAAFVAEMNGRARSIGASTAVFMDASGLAFKGSSVSAEDMLRILVHAAKIEGIREKWGKTVHEMSIEGDSARTERITTSVNSPLYDRAAYPIIGGKTGTITAAGSESYNLAWIASVEGKEYACVIIGDATDSLRWSDAEKVVEHLAGVSSTLDISAPMAASCELPADPDAPLNFTISKSPSVTGVPASLTKLMALVTAYGYIEDENEKVKIISSDLIGGSGHNLREGDRVSVSDLVHDMLLPSSNDASAALARHVGRRIMRQ